MMSSYNSAALLGGRYLEKGSTAAKARMAYLRSLRGKKLRAGAVPGAGCPMQRKRHPGEQHLFPSGLCHAP